MSQRLVLQDQAFPWVQLLGLVDVPAGRATKQQRMTNQAYISDCLSDLSLYLSLPTPSPSPLFKPPATRFNHQQSRIMSASNLVTLQRRHLETQLGCLLPLSAINLRRPGLRGPTLRPE